MAQTSPQLKEADSTIVQKIPEVQLEWKRIPVLSTAIRSVSQLTYFHINFALWETKERCVAYTLKMMEKLKQLGYLINFKKSSTISPQMITHLGMDNQNNNKTKNQTIKIAPKVPTAKIRDLRGEAKSTSNFHSSSFRLINSEASLRAQEQSFSKVKHMNINCCSCRACDTELNALKNSINSIE
ncbi:hypothetical protein BB561_006239 [Smittium simulii]|uniref:Uncharacterized protein n=1 Tax=Smittium simulii TaxID=133385 RepID=A0A2T9Y5N2_9FUNG|nr:hypothetical protein BB561_006239 [Smittium simulii]